MVQNLRIYEHPATVFCVYEEVMRDPNFFLINKILNTKKLREQFEEYLNLSIFDEQSEDRVKVLILNRTEKNIFKWLAKKKFDFDYNYNLLKDKFKTLYEESPALDMYRALGRMVSEPFLKCMYIYHPTQDKRIMYDIVTTFGKDNKDKVKFVTGPYLDVIEAIGPDINLYVDNDANRIAPLLHMEERRYNTFMVAQYGYNYEFVPYSVNPQLKEDLVRFSTKYKINLVEFVPFKVTKEGLGNG